MGSPCDWQVLKQKVSQRGQYLLETAQWSDCKFLVGTEPHQREFGAHKLFLAMSSPVFEAMFFGGMAEKNNPIPILDVQPDAFKALLEYMYTDAINLQSFDQACELCYVAKKYMLPHLVEECTKYIWQDLFPKNACRAYEFAKLFEEPVLMEKCLNIISSETEAVLGDRSFEDIEQTTLVSVLEQDELNINSELQLFDAALRWADRECVRKGLQRDGRSLRAVLGSAINKIRFLTLTPSEFAEGPAMSPFFTQDESFAVLMNISSTSGGKIPLPEGFSSSTTPRQRLPAAPKTPQPLLGGERGERYTCTRQVPHQHPALNTSILDCFASFTVNRDICVLGIQVPTQVYCEGTDAGSLGNGNYSELLYAHLLDSDGSRLTYTHFTSRVSYGQLVEIAFNRSVYIQRNKEYRVGVVFNKVGWYPMGTGTQYGICDAATFNFVGIDPGDSNKNGLIRSIIFTL